MGKRLHFNHDARQLLQAGVDELGDVAEGQVSESQRIQLLDQEKIAEEQVRSEVLSEPNVRAVMEAFPEATLESFTPSDAFEPTKGG